MKDANKDLLREVLKIHYTHRSKILRNALVVIKEYSAKPESTHSEYNEISNTLKHMLNDLPQEIVKYLLTMVPLPKDTNNLSLNAHDSNNTRTFLKDYLNNGIPPSLVPSAETKSEREGASVKTEETTPILEKSILAKKPALRGRRRGTRAAKKCRKLVDICADYFIMHQERLDACYNATKKLIWKEVNSNRHKEADLQRFYHVLRYLNHQQRLIRQLNNEELVKEAITENFYDENIILRECDVSEENLYEPNPVLSLALLEFVQK